MNYKESRLILEEIKKAKRILLSCHRNPDPDSIGSALALKDVLESMDRTVDVICPSKKLDQNVTFLKGFSDIKKDVDFGKFNFSKYDLFVVTDSASWDMASSNKSMSMPQIPIVVIDHHHTNERYGRINLVDASASSVGEMLFRIIKDWKFSVNKDTAIAILTGIIGDTGVFKYPNTSKRTFQIASDLIKNGADKEVIIRNIYMNYDFDLIKFWAEALSRLEIDAKYRFVYSAIPFETYEELGKPENAKESACDLFAQTIKGTDFGFMAVETEKNKLSVSLRSRLDFDSSVIATELGGGGHKAASGAKIEGLPFDKAIKKVLQVARKYAKKAKR